MKIYYAASSYQSHYRAARDYCHALSGVCGLTADITEADVVILHYEPPDYVAIYKQHPILKRKYVIAYAVWEASALPGDYEQGLSLVQEIWTCSMYCRDVLQHYHPRVVCVPHIVRRNTTTSTVEQEWIRNVISYDPTKLYYLTVSTMWAKRKNTRGLIDSFESLRDDMRDAFLIIKASPRDIDPGLASSHILCLRQHLTDSQLNALYEIADIYVSPHHSEGWGLTLSDAMLFGKPVIATGYSGNCEFMNPDNSILLDFTEEYIRSEDCYGLFKPWMKWAYPNVDDLQQKLVAFYQRPKDDHILTRVRQAASDLSLFSTGAIRNVLRRRLAELQGILPGADNPGTA